MFDDHGNMINEPPVDPLADTNPSIAIRPVDFHVEQVEDEQPAEWRQVVAVLSLLGTVGFIIATVALLLLPGRATETVVESPAMGTPVEIADAPSGPPPVIPSDDAQANAPSNADEQTGEQDIPPALMPTVSSDVIANLLNSPLQVIEESSDPIPVVESLLNPFTIIPDRPRNEVIVYEAVRGDTINTIAERYNLNTNSIGWSNSRRYVEILYPGDKVNIPPVDGVYMTTIGSKTIAEIADEYKVEPYVIIDSEYNNMFGATPDTIPPSGTRLMIEGGEAEPITWNPAVVREEGSDGSTGKISFASGQAGSCGLVSNVGGTYWTNPLPTGTWVRGFASWHTGVDVAASTGTPVLAANGGTVVFAGWNSWGYGNTVVLAHGVTTTLYGHLSTINVGCAQYVNAGQLIGGVGSTGNSSGPHLHFEVRGNDIPTDPTMYVSW